MEHYWICSYRMKSYFQDAYGGTLQQLCLLRFRLSSILERRMIAMQQLSQSKTFLRCEPRLNES